MRKEIRDVALVLDRRVFGDAHRIVVILGEKTGKASVLARHARRSRKRFGGSLELFSKIEVQLQDRGGGGLAQLKESSLIDSHPGITTDLVSIAHAGYLAELTSALLKEGQGSGQAFELLSHAFSALNHSPMNSVQLRRYELQLLDSVGLSPMLDGCVFCGKTESSQWQFDLDEGGIVCKDCTHGRFSLPISLQSLDFLRAIQDEAGEQDREKTAATMNECRHLLATLIDQHVGRKLKAREFLFKLAMGGN